MDLEFSFHIGERAACVLIAAPVLVTCLVMLIRRHKKNPVIVEH
jgi:hypothetical protein